jgi:integrase
MPHVMVRVVRVMPHLQKHPKSGVFYYRRVVPLNLRPALGQTEIRISLGTKDSREAKRRLPEKAAIVEAKFAAAGRGPVSLTHQQIVALAGAWYQRELARREVDPGPEEQLDLEFDQLEFPLTGGNWQKAKAARDDVAKLLKQNGLLVDEQSTRELELQLFDLKVRLVGTLRQRAQGDYTPDPLIQRLPKWDVTKQESVKNRLPLNELVDAWAVERKPAQRTRYEWERAVSRLASHVGHTNPTNLVPADIVSWKDALLASGKSPKTVKNHLAAVRALFGWAVRNHRMAVNPGTGIDVAAKEKGGNRRLPYSEEDAALLLRLARAEKGAKRWLPWLLAFTGARLEEVCQSLVRDIRESKGVWYLDINSDHETKSLKNTGSARKVPLHPALIEEGFLSYIRRLPADGPLFPDLTPDRFGRRGGNGTKIIGRWVRASGITNPRKAPNHAWRHRFKDVCRGAGIEKAVHDALTGHASGDVGDGYGLGYPLGVLATAIAKLPDPLQGDSGRIARPSSSGQTPVSLSNCPASPE